MRRAPGPETRVSPRVRSRPRPGTASPHLVQRRHGPHSTTALALSAGNRFPANAPTTASRGEEASRLGDVEARARVAVELERQRTLDGLVSCCCFAGRKWERRRGVCKLSRLRVHCTRTVLRCPLGFATVLCDGFASVRAATSRCLRRFASVLSLVVGAKKTECVQRFRCFARVECLVETAGIEPASAVA
jgi:hypothetical protein